MKLIDLTLYGFREYITYIIGEQHDTKYFVFFYLILQFEEIK
jgi:hypothetical protein|tara:strand:+ start:1176 stop:1301 length:126 start_codon:yes stop_codon:yes gene_type:complete